MALEYSIDVNGVLLEGVPTNVESCYLLQKVSGLDDTPVTDDVDARAVGDGDVFGAQSARGISLTVEGLIVAQDHADLRARERALRAACPTGDTPWPVTVTGRAGDTAGGLQALFRKSGPIQMADDGGSSAPRFLKPFQLVLRSESPWWVDPSPAGLNKIDVFAATPPGGLTWAINWNMNWWDGRGSPTAVMNAGSVAWPTLAIWGPCTDPIVENMTTGDVIRLETTILTEQALSINTRDRTITDRHGTNRYQDINRAETTWIRMAPGVNHIRFRAAAHTGNSRVTVTWRNTY